MPRIFIRYCLKTKIVEAERAGNAAAAPLRPGWTQPIRIGKLCLGFLADGEFLHEAAR